MEKELQIIKASMEALPNSGIQGPQNNTISSPSSLGHPQNESPVSPDASPDISLQAPGLVFATQTIDRIEIQASDIAELLQRSVNHSVVVPSPCANIMKVLYALSSPISNPSRPCFLCYVIRLLPTSFLDDDSAWCKGFKAACQSLHCA
jgi:hypothetical protein